MPCLRWLVPHAHAVSRREATYAFVDAAGMRQGALRTALGEAPAGWGVERAADWVGGATLVYDGVATRPHVLDP